MLPIYKAIPSLITLSALSLGINAINLAINGNIDKAILFIIIASVLDMFDGRVARILKVNSSFGAELDSLSDLVCFGIGTTFIVLFSRDSTNRILYLSAIFFSLTSAIRLAKFNITQNIPNYYKDCFIGLPTPASFILAITPIALENIFSSLIINNYLYSIYLLILGFLMISTIPTPSSKGLKISKNILPIFLGFGALFVIFFFTYPWIFLVAISITYICMILITIITVIKKKQKNLNSL